MIIYKPRTARCLDCFEIFNHLRIFFDSTRVDQFVSVRQMPFLSHYYRPSSHYLTQVSYTNQSVTTIQSYLSMQILHLSGSIYREFGVEHLSVPLKSPTLLTVPTHHQYNEQKVSFHSKNLTIRCIRLIVILFDFIKFLLSDK